MRVVDTIISREGDNSAWANVVFVGDGGETVSVRLPCPVPSGGRIGRERIAARAIKLLAGIVSQGAAGTQRSATGRFGVASEPEGSEGPEEDEDR